MMSQLLLLIFVLSGSCSFGEKDDLLERSTLRGASQGPAIRQSSRSDQEGKSQLISKFAVYLSPFEASWGGKRRMEWGRVMKLIETQGHGFDVSAPMV